MIMFEGIVKRIVAFIFISGLLGGCREFDATLRVATITPARGEATSEQLVQTVSPTVLFPIEIAQPTVTPPPSTIPAEISPPPASTTPFNLKIDDTLILSAVVQNENWLLKAYPYSDAFSGELFDTFYGPEVQMENVRRYTQFNFGPQLSPNGRYLLLPGVGGYGGLEHGGSNTGLWLLNLQTDALRQLLPQAKVATWSPHGDQIAYVDGETLYTLDVALGAEPVARFTHPDLWELYARWSPDGNLIATMSTVNFPEPIDAYWLVDVISGQADELAIRPSFAIEHVAAEMSWSPTGRYLLVRNELFAWDGQPLPTELQGGLAHWLPAAEALQSGEGEKLLLNGRSGFSIVTVDGEEIIRIAGDFVSTWAFSHNGRFLAYRDPLSETDLIIFNLETYESVRLNPSSVNVQSIQWSGNDDYLLLDDGRRTSPIWALSIEPDSQAQIVVERGTLIAALPAPIREVADGTAVIVPTLPPTIQPLPPAADDPIILFARDDDLWRSDLAGQQNQQLTDGGALGWGMGKEPGDWGIIAESGSHQISPNGRWVAFSKKGRTTSILDLWNPNSLRQMEPGAFIVVWSPDSRYLAYSNYGNLYLYDLEEDVLHEVLNSNQLNQIVWSPNMQHIAFSCCFRPPQPYNGTEFGEIQRVELATGRVEIIGVATRTVGGGTSHFCLDAAGNRVAHGQECPYTAVHGSRLSPDGMQRASFSPASPDDDFWEGDSLLTIQQVENQEVVRQIQIEAYATKPVWSPDGRTIFFQRGNGYSEPLTIWRVPANGTAVPEQIIANGYLLDVLP